MLPVARAVVADRREWYGNRHQALDLLALLGPEAAPAAGQLRETAADGTEEHAVRARAALALRALAPADREDVAPVLRAAWTADRDTRPRIAAALRREPYAPPAGFAELLRAELADPRRFGNTADPGRTPVRCLCVDDEALVADCRALLAASGQ